MQDLTGGVVELVPDPPQRDQCYDAHDLAETSARLDAEITAARAVEQRADARPGIYLPLCTGLLGAALAVLVADKLPGPAAAAGWLTTGLLLSAVAVLSTAARPNLRGEFGFVRWAGYRDPQQLIAALAADPHPASVDGCARQARQLIWLSRSVHRRFARIRSAQSLLLAALASAVAGAALTVLGR